MNIKEVLLEHKRRYPKVHIIDMVKLLYQNEFAGGHMIPDEAWSLKRLQDEMNQLKSEDIAKSRDFDRNNEKKWETIGNSLLRVNLKALLDSGIHLNTLNRLFVLTSNQWQGTVVGFEEKLRILRECCTNGELPFTLEEFDAYLEDYRKQGYPPVSHSEAYRREYQPAYRVIKEEYGKFLELFMKIDQLLHSKEKVVIAIEGGSASGKSTLGDMLQEIYQCNLFHMDDYFLRPEQRTPERLSEIGGNVDYERFAMEIVEGLKGNEPFQYQKFSCKEMALMNPTRVDPKRLNIVEGVYSMHPTLEHIYDLKIFLEIEKENQSNRILNRNGVIMHKRFMEEWIPKEDSYFDRFSIKEKCDLIYS